MSEKAGSLAIRLSGLTQNIDGLRRHVTDLRLDIARHEGYIDRVREMDGQARITRTRLSQAISRIAEEDLSAEQILQMSDTDFAKLVDKKSPALDRALGKDGFEDSLDD